MEIIKDIQEVEKVDNLEAAQKAKIKWAIEGDENTKFYHGILNKKRNQLGIRGVLKDGGISYQEIKRVVWDCGIDKSLAPDGVTFGFIRRYWSLIEKDVVAAVQHFFTFGNFPKGCNASFIALIPKILDAKLVKDFRPISLIGSLYKVIAKILANWLVGVLGDLVSEVQSAFIADRQILDGSLILNEVLQWCKAKEKQTFIFKIDFEKAYDSVRWDFLGDVLNRLGFCAKWCGCIQEFLQSSRGSVLVNGSLTEEFQFYKGLKQGDPLSLFLFILVMESLLLSFKKVEDAGMFNGIKINSSMTLSHMFYADDAIFMGQWIKRNIDTLMYMLKGFERASGLSINFSKCKFMELAVSIEKVGGCMSRIKSWDEVIDKMVYRLSEWKMKTLSIGGRLTLLKEVFGSMPIYHMSIFKVPMLVQQRTESIRCHFFNGNDLDSKRSIWVSWNKVLTSKEKGGLGVSSLFALNKALMFKWIGRAGNVGYTMPRSGIESKQWDHLLDSLEGVMLIPSEDRWSWDLNGSGEFSVASARRYIDNNRLPDISSKTRWIKEVPIKVNVHAWKVRINSLPTRWNISRRVLLELYFGGIAFGGM
nr:RNA-directed DNA polymerase, eukaryota [Tanacetum cinerariifolium]